MKKKSYKVGSLFAGIGGICTAFEQSGCEVVWANENDKHACTTYKHNYPKVKLYEESINTLVERDLIDDKKSSKNNMVFKPLKAIGIPEIDILTSGFPCQAFSVAGYRQGFNDEKGRGNLFFRTAEFIEAFKPKAFLLENVKNMNGHDKGKTIKVIEETIKNELGYSFIKFILNSKDFGNVPQNRERIYIVGFRNESSYSINDSTKTGNILTHNFNIPKPIKLTKTIHDLLEVERQEDKFYYNSEHQYYKELNDKMSSRDTIYQWRRVYVRENKNKLCPTLTANMGTGGHNVPLIIDNFGIRKLIPSECLKFQGFPRKFKFPSGMAASHCYKQAGNSVVVPVIKRIADEIVRVLSLSEE